jgi:hypothetical protein
LSRWFDWVDVTTANLENLFGKLLVLLYLALRTGDMPSVSSLPVLLSTALQQQRLCTLVQPATVTTDTVNATLPSTQHQKASDSMTDKKTPLGDIGGSSGSHTVAIGSSSSSSSVVGHSVVCSASNVAKGKGRGKGKSKGRGKPDGPKGEVHTEGLSAEASPKHAIEGEPKTQPRKVSNLVAAVLCLASPVIQEDLKMMSELMLPLYNAHGSDVKALMQGPDKVLHWYAHLSTGCWLEDLSAVFQRLVKPLALARMGLTVEGPESENTLDNYLAERIDKLAFALVRYRARSCVWYSQGLPGLLAGLTCEYSQARALSKIKTYYQLYRAAKASEMPTILKATDFMNCM